MFHTTENDILCIIHVDRKLSLYDSNVKKTKKKEKGIRARGDSITLGCNIRMRYTYSALSPRAKKPRRGELLHGFRIGQLVSAVTRTISPKSRSRELDFLPFSSEETTRRRVKRRSICTAATYFFPESRYAEERDAIRKTLPVLSRPDAVVSAKEALGKKKKKQQRDRIIASPRGRGGTKTARASKTTRSEAESFRLTIVLRRTGVR